MGPERGAEANSLFWPLMARMGSTDASGQKVLEDTVLLQVMLALGGEGQGAGEITAGRPAGVSPQRVQRRPEQCPGEFSECGEQGRGQLHL